MNFFLIDRRFIIFFIGLSIAFSLGLVSEYNCTAATPILIHSKYEPVVIKEGGRTVVTITLENTVKVPVRIFDVQITSTGLKVENDKKWPVLLFPGSALSGQYTLLSLKTGRYPIYLTVTYELNSTQNSKTIAQQNTSEYKIGDIEVEPDVVLVFSPFWQGVVSTLSGSILGIILTKIIEKISTRGAAERQRREGIMKVKNYLLFWVGSNEQKIKKSQPAEFGIYDNMLRETPFHLLLDNYTLQEEIQKLYSEFSVYNRLPDLQKQAESTNLLTKIESVVKLIKNWSAN